MFDVNITSHAAARCLGQLMASTEPLTAIMLADRIGLAGQRESKRRKVRELIKRLRDQGVKIVATRQGGYWLTQDHATWQQWNEHRQIDAKRILKESHRRKKESRECDHQGFLFEPAQGIPD